MKCRIRDLHLIAAEREVNTSECDEKIDTLAEKCAWNVARKLIEPTQKARNDIYQIIFDIEDRVETAKKWRRRCHPLDIVLRGQVLDEGMKN
uniref:Uncharacterized protein n=1 Tax=Trichogramma kaykai TaxID=54128 RepID=A0ABD2XI81_9HYME